MCPFTRAAHFVLSAIGLYSERFYIFLYMNVTLSRPHSIIKSCSAKSVTHQQVDTAGRRKTFYSG